MPLTLIIVIRHAEKPQDPIYGVAPDGSQDKKSLAPRGCQRAGALVRFFSPNIARPGSALLPTTTSAVDMQDDSDSRRPSQSVIPLAALLAPSGVPFVTTYGKDELQPLLGDALARDGIVLIFWEHKRMPRLAGLLNPVPVTPAEWLADRSEIRRVFDRSPGNWRFSQLSQLLLADDRVEIIA